MTPRGPLADTTARRPTAELSSLESPPIDNRHSASNPPQAECSAGPCPEVVDPRIVADWDGTLAKRSDATIFHSAAWARVLVETYRFEPAYILQRDDSSSSPSAVRGLLPLMRTGSRWRGHRLVSLPFTDACPPLLPENRPADPTSTTARANTSTSLHDIARGQPLLRTALEQAQTAGARFLELRDSQVWTHGLAPSVTFYGHVIPLESNEADQLARCSPAMRRALRKADRSPLCLKEGRELADIEAYYKLHCQTRQRHGIPPQPFAFFRNIQKHLLARGLGFVVLAMDGPTAVAGAVFFGFGRRSLYKFGASSESHLEWRPNNLVLWHGIRRCAELGFDRLDLGRTSLDNDGLRRFKSGLGGEERVIHCVRHDVHLGSIVETPDRAHGWHNRVFRLLPRPASRALGELLYRYVT